MRDDQQLLKGYADNGSEDAFSDLVARYVNLVHSAALRRTGGDLELAKDVAQLVFTDLARKARSLPKGVLLAGWLHRASRFAAAQLLRADRRRRAREQEAATMNTLGSEPPTGWDHILPLLDDALDRLGRRDREALLLRFFEQRSLAEVATALGRAKKPPGSASTVRWKRSGRISFGAARRRRRPLSPQPFRPMRCTSRPRAWPHPWRPRR